MLGEVFQNLLLASRDAAVLALAIGLLLLVFGRWIAPVWRHWLWLLVALRLLLPVLPSSPTSWQCLVPEAPPEVAGVAGDAPDDGLSMPVSSGEASRQISTSLFPESSAPGSPEATDPVLSGLEKESPGEKPWATLTAWDLLGIVWIIGLAIVLGLIGAVTLRFVRRLRRLTIDHHPQFAMIHSLLEGICGEAGLRRVPRLRITEAVLSPALTGLFRPEILLPPATIERLEVSELRLVLLHELGHLRRRDVWTNWVLSLLQAVHWFNPLVWWAFHRTRIESERATDAWVLEHSGEGQAGNYGQALIHLLESSARPSGVLGVVGVIESRRDLRKRLLAIGRFSGKRSRLAALGGIALLLGIAAVGLTQAPKEDPVIIPLIENRGNSRTTSKKEAKEKSFSVSQENREVEHFKFPYQTNQIGWAYETGRLSFWINGDWKLNLPDGEFLPVRFGFMGNQDRDGGGMLGESWWVPLLESNLAEHDGRYLRVTTLGGRAKFLIVDKENKDHYQTEDHKWAATHRDGDWFEVRGPGGWFYYYHKGRLVKLNTPSGKTLTWNFDTNSHVTSIAWEDGSELLTVLAGANGLVKEISIVGGPGFSMTYQPYPQVGSERGEVEGAGSRQYASRITERLAKGGIGREFTFDVSTDPEHQDILWMDYTRMVPGRDPVKETFSWQASSGLIKSDSESTYEKVPASEGSPPKITRKFNDGGQEVYIWDQKKKRLYRERRNGSSYEIFYVKDSGPANFKVERTIHRKADGEVDEHEMQFDDAGRIIRTIRNGELYSRHEYSVRNGEKVVRIFQKNGSAEKNSENGLVLYRTSYSSIEDGRKLRDETNDLITEYDSQGRIVKVVRNGVVERDVDFDKSTSKSIEVLEPDGEMPAAGAKFTILDHGATVHFMNLEGRELGGDGVNLVADKNGRASFPGNRIVFRSWIVHKSGYRQIDEQFLKEMDGKPIQLLPFGEVEGTLKLDGKLVAGRKLQFEAPIPQLGDPTKFDFWGVTVQTGKKGEFRTDQLVPWDQPYRVYLVDDVTGEKSPERVAEMQVKSGAVGQVEIDYDEASLVRVKGRFVDTKGDSFESQGLGVVNVLAIPVNGRSPMNAQIRPEKDSVFLTGPIRPGHYYLDGKIVGKSGRGGRFALSDWRVPADAVTKAKDGIYDMGDVSLAWPSGGDSTVEEMSTPGQVTIQVVDAGSKLAIEGAAINPRGLYIGSSTLGWDPRTDKPGPETVTTGADGKAVLPYPEKLVGDRVKKLGDPMVIAVRLRVSHPDYLTEGTVRYNVDGSSPAIELRKGATLRVSATLPDGKGPVGEQLMVQVTDIRQSFESDAWGWEEMPGGQGRQRVHHLVPSGERIVRVAHRDKKGRLFFSDPEVIKFEKQETHQLRSKLRMGRPFSGKLDGKIPRPVKGAWVTVMVAPENENWDNLYGALRWQSTADVAGDGSFRFDYLPPGKLAIAAGCDGWAHAIDQTGSSGSTVQYVPSQGRGDATIRMVKVGACRVLLTKPDGSPLPNASVSFWPNQSWPGRGSTIFGQSRYSTEWGFDTGKEKKQEDALLKSREQVPENAWSGTTDAEGMVVIGNLPFSKEEIFRVEHPEYRLPADIHGQRYGRVKVESGKTVEVTLKMEEIGKPEKRAATTAPEKETEQLSNGFVTPDHASQIANAEARREFQVEPFAPGDFKEAVDGKVKVFTATAPLEKDELKAQVFFSEDSVPDVRLSIMTGRVFPQKKGIEPGMEKVPINPTRKVK